MAGILTPGTSLDELLAQLRGQQPTLDDGNAGVLYQQQNPQASPTGNKRDSVSIVQRASTVPDLTPQTYQPKGILARVGEFGHRKNGPDQALLALSAGLLSGAGDRHGNFFSALGQGMQGFNSALTDERTQFDQSEQKRLGNLVNQAQLQQGQDRNNMEAQRLADEGWVNLGGGVIHNSKSGVTRTIPEVQANELAQIRAKARAEAENQQPQLAKQDVYTYKDDDTGHVIHQSMDRLSGKDIITDLTAGTTLDKMPANVTLVSQTGSAAAAKQDLDVSKAMNDDAVHSGSTIATLQSMKSITQNVGDPGVKGDTLRAAARFLGTSVGDADFASVAAMDGLQARMELSLAQDLLKGGGAISDNERRIASKAAVDPTKLTKEERIAFYDMSIREQQRKIDMAKDWRALPRNGRPSASDYQANWDLAHPRQPLDLSSVNTGHDYSATDALVGLTK